MDFKRYKTWEPKTMTAHRHSEIMLNPLVRWKSGYYVSHTSRNHDLIILKRSPYVIKIIKNLISPFVFKEFRDV
jgi:hypothetical protein